jgi:Tol biopolymer transport system component
MNTSMSVQLRTVIAIVLFLASWPRASFPQQASAPTDWEIKQLAYDVWYQPENTYSTTTYTDIFVRSGPKLKSKRVLKDAKLPKWSPDGRNLIFLDRCRLGGGDVKERAITGLKCVATAEADGSHRILLTDRPKDWISATNFAWSPSGDEIAYIEGDTGFKKASMGMTIGIVRADGSGRRSVEHLQCSSALMATIDWSPDGQKIAFAGCSGIIVVDRTGENAHVVTAGGGKPLWSPDGKMLLFQKKGLCVVNADGTQERVILDAELAIFGLTWLPNGRSIAFASTRDHGGSSQIEGLSEIFRINIDGTGLKKIASGAQKGLSFASPIFSPDEQELVVVSGSPDSLWEDILSIEPLGDIPKSTRGSIPIVLLIDLSSSREERLVEGSRPSVVWGHK